MSSPALAIDPGTVQGHLQYGTQRHELRYVQVVKNPNDAKRLWILLTTAEVSPKDAADPGKMLALAAGGKLRGVRLNVDSAAPKADELQLALLLSREESPEGEIVFGASGNKFWERLAAGDKRIGGVLRYARERSPSGSPAWAIDATFSAPVFGK
ncbi:MAG: hypothetical protein K8R60_20460 [Burkholderiales bacterium]|nr:hypothetical protein [Burkholderiales bacterium]